MAKMVLVSQENRVLLEQAKQALKEFLGSLGSHIIQELKETQEVQEHRSQDQRESEPPDLQAT